MPKHIKLALLGGDMRQISVAQELSRFGFTTELWGIDKEFCVSSDICLCNEWSETINNCDALVLPLPASADGVRVNCPLLSDSAGVKLSKLLDLIPRETLILGGKFSPSLKLMMSDKGFRYIDYFLREELQIKNAVPTAEGALALAMNELPITLSGAKAAIIGYGRIGKILAAKLKALNANVTVAARKTTDLALAESVGLDTLHLVIDDERNTLEALTSGYDVIFNTVPSWLLDEKIVNIMSHETLIIDLASAPGGIDIHAAKERGLKVIWALSLPGKNSPYTAGKIIAQTIVQILTEEGILT